MRELAFLPIARFTVKMHDRDDRDNIRSDSEQDAEGKGFGQTATDIPFDQWEEVGIDLDLVQGVSNSREEAFAKVLLP